MTRGIIDRIKCKGDCQILPWGRRCRNGRKNKGNLTHLTLFSSCQRTPTFFGTVDRGICGGLCKPKVYFRYSLVMFKIKNSKFTVPLYDFSLYNENNNLPFHLVVSRPCNRIVVRA